MENGSGIKLKIMNFRTEHVISFLVLIACLFQEYESNAQRNMISDESTNEGVSATYQELSITSGGKLINNGKMFIYDDINNEGEITSESKRSIFNLKGNKAQKIKGSGTSLFSNILFDNSSEKAPFSIEKNITIQGNADFTDGIISYSGRGLIIFDTSGETINVSKESFVVDRVRKKGDNSFIFPVGDHKDSNYVYRKLRMDAPSNPNSVVDVQFVWDNPGDSYDTDKKEDEIEIIDNQEYWKVDDSSGTSLPDLTFYWDSSTTPSSILTSGFEDRITVARWNGRKWISEKVLKVDDSGSIEIEPSGDGIFTFALLKEEDEEEVPDYYPTLFTKDTQVNGNTGRIDFVIFVGESNGVDSNGTNPVEVRIASSENFIFRFDDTLTTLNGRKVNNSDWEYKLERGLHKFIYSGNDYTFPGDSFSMIGVNAVFVSPANSKGDVPLKVTVKADSGGQEFTGNDNDQDIIRYDSTSDGGNKE